MILLSDPNSTLPDPKNTEKKSPPHPLAIFKSNDNSNDHYLLENKSIKS